jgi:hypothetical protein
MRFRFAWCSGLLFAVAACGRPSLRLVADGPRLDAGAGNNDASAGRDGSGAPAPSLDWGIPVGQPASPTAEGVSVATAVVPVSDGGVVVAGVFSGTVSFAGDKTLAAGAAGSGFVARYRRDRQLVWVTPFAAGSIVVADMAALGNDEVAIGGWFEGTLTIPGAASPRTAQAAGSLDAFVARVAADGSVRWMTRAGGRGDDIVRAIAARRVPDVDGQLEVAIAISGAVGEGASFGNVNDAAAFPPPAPPGSGPVYVARINGDGRFEWVSFAGAGVPGQAYGVALDAAGGVAATGYVNGRAPFGTTTADTAIEVDPVEGRGFVARWESGGRIAWAQPLAGSEGEGKAIAIGDSGQIVACGQFEGSARFGREASAPTLTADFAEGRPAVYLAEFSSSGAPQWARRLTGVGIWPWRARFAPGGELVIAGSFGAGIVLDPDGPRPTRLFSNGGDDALFARLTPTGDLIWVAAGGGLGDDEAADVAGATDGFTWAVGSYTGPATFGTADSNLVTLTSGTDGNAFLMRYGRSGGD